MGQCCALPYAVDASCTVCSVCESAESDGRRVAYRVQCCSVLCAVPTQLCSFAEMGIGSHVRPARQSQCGGVWYCSSMPCCVVCRMQCLSRRGKCRAALSRKACGASAYSSHAAPWGHFASLVRSASPARLPSASLRRISLQSRDCLRVRVRRGYTAIFPPSALFPGISRRCTWRSVASVRAQRRPSVARLP